MKQILILFGRSFKHLLRSPDTIITVAISPICIMLMFVFVLGGAVKDSLPEGVNYVNYQLPGILIMAVASGSSYTAFRIFSDVKEGLFSRFHSMPINRSSVLWAHVFVSVVSNMITLLIIFAVAFLVGFRTNVFITSWLVIVGIFIILSLALTWIAVIPGLTAKTADGAGVFAYPILFLPFFSSAFVPTETMPTALRIFAENQPMTPIVNTLRNLTNGAPIGNEIWVALAWCIGICVVAYFVAMGIYKRKA